MTELVPVEPGVRIHVRDLGEGDPVLLIHGWSLSHEVFDRQINVLTQQGHRVLAMDLRGHGGSDAPLTGYGIERLARDAVEVLRQRDTGPVSAVGWSLGGMTALRLAASYPELVSRVVLVASTGVAAARHPGYPFGVPPEAVEPAFLAAELDDRLAHRAKAVGDPFKAPPDRRVLDWLVRISLGTPSWAANACMSTLLRTEQVGLLDTVTAPVTQIVGTADPALSLRGAKWVSERLGSPLVELDCGHYPMLEQAAAFDDVLRKALAA